MALKESEGDPRIFNIGPVPVSVDDHLSLDWAKRFVGPDFGYLIDRDPKKKNSPKPWKGADAFRSRLSHFKRMDFRAKKASVPIFEPISCMRNGLLMINLGVI